MTLSDLNNALLGASALWAFQFCFLAWLTSDLNGKNQRQFSTEERLLGFVIGIGPLVINIVWRLAL